jgi:hypothetical protein
VGKEGRKSSALPCTYPREKNLPQTPIHLLSQGYIKTTDNYLPFTTGKLIIFGYKGDKYCYERLLLPLTDNNSFDNNLGHITGTHTMTMFV